MERVATPRVRFPGLGRIGGFVRHYLEMCFVMCLGFGVLDLAYFGLAGQLGYSKPFAELPELSVLVVTFNMTLPMVWWMRFRGMTWRPNLEMSAAMVVEAVLIIAAGSLGLVERSSMATLEHLLMMPFMLVPMLLRFDYYASPMHHHGAHMA